MQRILFMVIQLADYKTSEKNKVTEQIKRVTEKITSLPACFYTRHRAYVIHCTL